MFGAVLGRNARLRFNGAFSTTSASSPVTSATRTCLRGGTVLFNIVAEFADLEYSKNGGAWTDITEGLTLAFAMSDTLAVRDTLPSASDESIFTLKDDANSVLIETVTLTRS